MLTEQRVIKKTLANGLVVLVHPVHHVARVAVNLWYGVGSKHEKSGQKGLAHLIEHMIFKGTHTKLSEGDIDAVTTKLSGYVNAFTSYDYTCYVFDLPRSSWQESLVLLAETMRNCHFDPEMLNSELSAVIQELKMYKDDYFDTLLSALSAAVFADHPYHYPIIGFKQDLWNLERQALVEFYQQHYVPNNAVLVVVGDVDPEQVFEKAQQEFGHIPFYSSFVRQEFYHSKNISNYCVTLYRDVSQPQTALSFVLPGAKHKQRYIYELVTCILGKGKSSRLYAKIVDELGLACELHASLDQREDATLLDITFQPNTVEDNELIIQTIQQEIQNIIDHGITAQENKRIQKQVKASLYSIIESPYEQAGMIGESYLLTGDEQLIFKELARDIVDMSPTIQEILKNYCQETMRHEGRIVPMTEDMQAQADELQTLSDQEDQRILHNRLRTTAVQEPRYVHQVSAPSYQETIFTLPERCTLKNGLQLLTVNRSLVPLIDIVLSLPVKEYADPEDKQGLYRFVCDMLLEGTKKYPGLLFAQEVEGFGMTLSAEPGIITLTVLKEDLTEGLMFLKEVLTEAEFDDAMIEKVRGHLLSDLLVYWDEPQEFANQVVRQELYKGHSHSKDPNGTIKAIKKITKKDLVAWYKKVCTPQGAHLAIVGDTRGYDVPALVQEQLGAWSGDAFEQPQLHPVSAVTQKTLKHPIARDQVVLMFAGHSITRLDKDYEALLLFDQIFGGGSQGSMSSRLFKIREQTGLFYGVGGSLVVGCSYEPGMVLIKTTVSLDRLEEAKSVLTHTMQTVIDSLTPEEFEQAKRTIIDGLSDNVSSNKKVAGAFLGIVRFGFDDDYFATFAKRIQELTLEEVKAAAKKVLDVNKMITVEIGRV